MILLAPAFALGFLRQEEEDSLSKVSQSFREYSQGQGTLTLVLATVLLALLVVAIAYSILSTRRASPAWRIFREFSEANGLTIAETRLFISVAERVQPDNPAALFVKRSLFETAVQDLQIDAGQATALREKIYGP